MRDRFNLNRDHPRSVPRPLYLRLANVRTTVLWSCLRLPRGHQHVCMGLLPHHVCAGPPAICLCGMCSKVRAYAMAFQHYV